MNAELLHSTIRNILSEKRGKFDDGVAGAADMKYEGCIIALKSLIATGSVKTDEDRQMIGEALDEFNCHKNLGTIVDGVFKPISCAMAARWDIISGSVISGGKLPVVTRDLAAAILDDIPGAVYPTDSIWDNHRNALIHLSFYYRRYPKFVLGLKSNDVARLGLRKLFSEELGKIT